MNLNIAPLFLVSCNRGGVDYCGGGEIMVAVMVVQILW